MTNDSVLRMAKAGLADDLIVQTINAQPGQYDTDADSLVTLKQAGVSDRVITAMVNKGRIQLTERAGAAGRALGRQRDRRLLQGPQRQVDAIEPEIVHIKSGGFIKTTVTDGIIKEDTQRHVNGRESKLLLPRPIEFLIYTPDGVDVTEYDLLRFRLNSDSREFRVLTGGVFHSTGGAERDEVTVQAGQDCAPHLPVHPRQGHPRRRVRHPAAGHRQRHQRRQDLHVRHHRVESAEPSRENASASQRPKIKPKMVYA